MFFPNSSCTVMSWVYYELYSLSQELGNGMYTAKLLITEFMEEDANMEYMLIVENDMGETPYKIKLSMNEAPAGKLDAMTSHHNYFKFIIAILHTLL